jgi:hypothetical protein
MVRYQHSRYEYPTEFAWGNGAQFRSDVVPYRYPRMYKLNSIRADFDGKALNKNTAESIVF